MPKGTKVHKVFDALRRSGHSKASSARIAQAQTGQSLATGRPSKSRRKATTRRTRK